MVRLAKYLRTQLNTLRQQRNENAWHTNMELISMLEHIDRLAEMPGTKRVCFDLWMDIKLHVLQREWAPDMTSSNGATHYQIDQHFRDIMKTGDQWSSRSRVPFLDSAQRCREIRARMRCSYVLNPIPTFQGSLQCSHKVLLSTLDIVQRNAYVEIRIEVLRAVRGRLPTELAEIVFEFTMATEAIPLDPRIVVRTKYRESNERRLKCRIPCEYMCVLDQRVEWESGQKWQVTGHSNPWIIASRSHLLRDSNGGERWFEDKFEQDKHSSEW